LRGCALARDRAPARTVSLPPADSLHDAHPTDRRRAPGVGPARHPARGLRELRRSPEPAPRGVGAGGGALLIPPTPRPARRGAFAPAKRAALGAGGGAPFAGGGADGWPGRGTRAGRPAHLRAVVHACRTPVATAFPLCRSRALRSPAAAGSGLHDRGRGQTAGVLPDQDAAAARPRLPGTHRRRNAALARLGRRARARGAAFPDRAADAGVGLVGMTPP